jgi:NACalpha-BTF3-like transcription factor
MQYQGPPAVWGAQLLADNISIAGPNACAIASGVTYWMGIDKFYKYDGRTQTLRCDLRQFIFQDINLEQAAQIFASTNEGFNEVWFFYCSANSFTIDKYVTYNYAEDVWAYGTMARTAWLDSALRQHPMAATYSYNIVFHEQGNDDNETGTTLPINAVIETTEFDIDDGDHFGFVWRIVPDITFRGSDTASPQVTMTLIPMQNSGSGYNSPISLGGNSDATIVRTATVPIEEFTGEIEDRDIDLVLRHAERVSRASVEAYLRHFHGDIVETIMFLVYHKKMPIPDFRERERPPLAEPYVSPMIGGRVTSSRRAEADRGYESS